MLQKLSKGRNILKIGSYLRVGSYEKAGIGLTSSSNQSFWGIITSSNFYHVNISRIIPHCIKISTNHLERYCTKIFQPHKKWQFCQEKRCLWQVYHRLCIQGRSQKKKLSWSCRRLRWFPFESDYKWNVPDIQWSGNLWNLEILRDDKYFHQSFPITLEKQQNLWWIKNSPR